MKDKVERIKTMHANNLHSKEDVPVLLERIRELEITLQEISKGEGPYNEDPLKHAANCIEDMKRIAKEALDA
jgi:hypothetical protein